MHLRINHVILSSRPISSSSHNLRVRGSQFQQHRAAFVFELYNQAVGFPSPGRLRVVWDWTASPVNIAIRVTWRSASAEQDRRQWRKVNVVGTRPGDDLT